MGAGNPQAPVVRWQREYVAANPMPPTFVNAIEALTSSPREGDISADALRQIVYGILSQPRKLADAVPEIASLVGRDAEETKAMIAEMVRVFWIQEFVTTPQIDRPIFIIAAARAGGHILFEQLMKIPGLWSIGGESHHIFDPVLQHNFANPRFSSVRALATDASQARTLQIVRRITRTLGSLSARQMYLDLPSAERPQLVRLLDKLPKNAYRIPFINASFPDAQFIFVVREPRGNISSLIDAWREGQKSGRFVRYQNVPGSMHENWCFALPPGWQLVANASIEEIAAFQWASANQVALRDLSALPRHRWTVVNYADLVRTPLLQLGKVCDFLQVPFDASVFGLEEGKLPVSKMALTPTDPEKWRNNEESLRNVLPLMQQTARGLAAVLGVVHNGEVGEVVGA